ncbi:MAG: 2-oxoacid:ferredoxin oxidoreductase subunit beta [Candidatus Neomarinimicrobiota bacterium]|nr:2-oxoacid:ferredoxin oxidoreductase subunit beta [Candidatus Neomarinimicrobiota bacterium]
MTETDVPTLTRKDFVSDQDVRWCPGCGDYSILAQTQKTMPELGVPKEKFVFVAGIGCSSRFPYYMDTFGFHTIHGRAPAIASGVKLANPDLSVWVITGDGDALSIGGNHLIHLLRRNLDINIVLFNNEIYGLTKGQYSPTSEFGKKTKSSPFGSLDRPFNPPSVALGTQSTFVARTVDSNTAHLQASLKRAYEHKGTSFLEVYQNCLIYNDGAFSHVTDKAVKDDNILDLQHGQPMVFGGEGDKGIRLDGFTAEVVTVGKDVSMDDLLVHDEHDKNLAAILANFTEDESLPTPLGVIFSEEQPNYEALMTKQIESAKEKLGEGDLQQLIIGTDTWEVA